MKILLSSYACDPSKGSEPGNGFNWANELSKLGLEVFCFTQAEGEAAIKANVKSNSNLKFIYVKMPKWLNKLYYRSQAGMYFHYLLWQWKASQVALKLHKSQKFDLVHHVTWGSIQLGSFMYRLKIPFIFGPSGGGQMAPESLKKYFGGHWVGEERRLKVSNMLVKYNPACYNMLKGAQTILVSNKETLNLAQSLGARSVFFTFDAALPSSFFPSEFPERTYDSGLKLLWVGRLMPRKGLPMVLNVMKKLETYKDISLTIVGDGEMKESILKQIEDLELGEKVDYKGTVPFKEVKEVYKEHDVFFFTSLRDSCPAQLIEALSFGLPVVTLDLHGQSIIVNDKIGIKCSIDDPEDIELELSKAILQLYNDKTLVRKMSLAAYNFGKKQNWERKVASIVGEYYSQPL